MTIRRSSGSPSRRLRIESLEGRSMLSGGSLTPAEAIQQLNAQSAVVATQTSQQQANTLNLENGLLAVAHQLDADNLSQISYANSHGNPQAAVADMQERQHHRGGRDPDHQRVHLVGTESAGRQPDLQE